MSLLYHRILVYYSLDIKRILEEKRIKQSLSLENNSWLWTFVQVKKTARISIELKMQFLGCLSTKEILCQQSMTIQFM